MSQPLSAKQGTSLPMSFIITYTLALIGLRSAESVQHSYPKHPVVRPRPTTFGLSPSPLINAKSGSHN